MTQRHSPALTGALATGAGLAVTELLAGILKVRASPVVAIGETVIELTPGMIAHRIISVVGHADKPLAITSCVLAILLLGALLGRLWLKNRVFALVGIVAMVAVAVAAVMSRPNTGSTVALLCVAGGIVTMAALDFLSREKPAASPDASRRAFIRNAGFVAAGSVLAVGFGRFVGHSRVVVEKARSKLRLPTREVATPVGADLGVDRLAPWRTPTETFYRIDTALSVPLIEPSEWRLRIHGMVDKELTLTYQDLLDRGLSDAWITLCCVSNEVGGNLIGNTVWSGVPIKDILEEVGIKPRADALLSTSQDGWTAGTPLEALTDGRNSLLAVAMNGEPLPIEHGFPVRQVVPGLYGYVSATKWVTDWEITRFQDFSAYWTDRGWSAMGPIKTESRIDVPRGKVKAGTVKVAGTAWAQNRGVKGVEVRVDGGSWNQATLAKVPNLDTWVQWVWEWEASSGDHTLEVRATDSTGTPQTSKRADVLPDGATGYDRRTVTVTT
ncbi:MAG: molybdopterin-dependent oxidoreductase [Aeromicrobium sp.]